MMRASKNQKKVNKDLTIIEKDLTLALFLFREMEVNTHRMIDDIYFH